MLQSLLGRHATCLLVRIKGDAYAYSGETGVFTRVPRMPVDLPDQLEQAQHALASIDHGQSPYSNFTWHYSNITGHESLVRANTAVQS